VARHADRKPTSYPSDPYFQYWERISNRKLTKNGIRRSFHVGEELQKEYKTFLPKDIRDVYARSQDSDVCLETCETILAALFPPQGDKVWNENLIWQPIAVHAKPIIEDNVSE
ncbi:prostatic acid phosphatase-like protein, partial [Leptotrombidium deliense]